MMVTLFLDFVSQGGWHGNGRPDTKQNTRGPCRVTNRDLEASIIQLAKRAYRYMYETRRCGRVARKASHFSHWRCLAVLPVLPHRTCGATGCKLGAA